jgi:hypothetical protein
MIRATHKLTVRLAWPQADRASLASLAMAVLCNTMSFPTLMACLSMFRSLSGERFHRQ